MKLIFKSRGSVLITALFLSLLLSDCNENTASGNGDSLTPKSDTASPKNDTANDNKKYDDCAGYTGKLTDKKALELKNKCHFIPAELIREWTDRYQKNKKTGIPGKLPGIGDLLGDSSSFNSCIIRKIISNKESIGLRVVYGMSEDYKIHVIFVGIKPDYSSLYIKQEDACCDVDTKRLAAPASPAPPPPPGKVGGAEYGQMP